MTNYRTLTVEQKGALATITLDMPDTLNALSLEMVEELLSALGAVVRSGSRAVMLTGAGRGFCSGAQLSPELDFRDPDYDLGRHLETHYSPLMQAIRDLPVPFITAVNGIAAGGGCAVALAGDIIVAAEEASFLQPFRNIGLVPDAGSAYLLVHAIGRTRAMEMMMLGEKIAATQALQWGLVTRVVPAPELLPSATRIGIDLANGPTQAFSMMRRQCWAASEQSFHDMLAMERLQQREAGRSADHREGLSAFLAKRSPTFSGQ